MRFMRLTAGRYSVARGLLAAGLVLAALGPVPGPALTPARAADAFPFDQELLLDAAPMERVKRMPVLTVAANGQATIDLWCRTVVARVQLSDAAIKIETAPLPEALPQYMSAGQCSEPRILADTELLEALTQVTEWRRQGDRVLLNGPNRPKPMPFRLSSH